MNIYISILAEFFLISSSIILLFNFRSKLGLAPLYILLGGVQYLQALSGTMVSFYVLGNIPIYPGSVIVFSAVLFAVLLIYIKEGVSSARGLIIGIIISNFILSALFGITYVQEYATQIISVEDSSSVFQINYKYFIAGTLILLVDFILLVIIYQFLISKISKRYFFFTLFISLFSVLIFDALAFNIILKYDAPDFNMSLIGHIIGKSFAGLVFSIILYGYLKFIDTEKTSASFIASQNRDIFSIVKYRKKYFNLKVEKKQVEQKLTTQLETALNNISDGFVSLDTNWCYTYINEKAAVFLGKSPESLMGKNIWTEFPEGVNLPFYKTYHKAVDTQKTIYFEDYYEPLDKWFENRIYPSPDGLTIYFTDITEKKNADLTLKKSEYQLRTILETGPECIKQLSAKGELIYMNPAGLAMIEADNLEMVKGQPMIDLISPNYQRAFKKLTSEVFKGNSGKLEFEIKGLKGTNKWLETDAVAFRDSEGHIISLLGVTRDITSRKEVELQLRDSEQLFRRLSSNAPVAIFQTDKEGSCNYVNEEWMKYSGMSFEAAMGFGWINAIHSDDKERVMNEVEQAIVAGGDSVLEYRFQNLKKQTTWLSTKTVELHDAQNKLNGYIGMAIDITERKKAEDELKKHRHHLEELVEVRTTELEKEKVKAQSADMMKSAFLAAMSHELRTPMNSIIGFTGILLKELAGPINDEQKKQLGMVKNSGEHLLGLINDILDISKIEAGKLKVTNYPFNYLTSLERTVDFLAPQVSVKGLNLITQIDEMEISLISDERRVEQILLNLISNAIKFSKNGTILVKVAVKDDMLITQVIDQGIGISKKDLVKLFMPFIQLEGGLSRSHEGTGLGLAICKSLIEKLGGTIHVDSQLGKGSNFTFMLPLEYSNIK